RARGRLRQLSRSARGTAPAGTPLCLPQRPAAPDHRPGPAAGHRAGGRTGHRGRLRLSGPGLPDPAGDPEPGLLSAARGTAVRRHRRRSEEHTSELQSRFDLVCRLLLEKKKKNSSTTVEKKHTTLDTSHQMRHFITTVLTAE